MRKFLLVLIVLAVVSAHGFAQAKSGAIGLQGSMVFTGTTLGSSGSVGAKMVVADNLAVRVALGLQNSTDAAFTETLFDLAAALEFHFGGGKGSVSPYAGAEISYSSGTYTGLATPYSNFGVVGLFGGEYFFSSNFSWAGEARVGFLSLTNPTSTQSVLGTFGFATFLTWYLN